jgi:hypothetical protein
MQLHIAQLHWPVIHLSDMISDMQLHAAHCHTDQSYDMVAPPPAPAGGNVARNYLSGTLLTNNAICLTGIAITVIGLQASVGKCPIVVDGPQMITDGPLMGLCGCSAGHCLAERTSFLHCTC